MHDEARGCHTTSAGRGGEDASARAGDHDASDNVMNDTAATVGPAVVGRQDVPLGQSRSGEGEGRRGTERWGRGGSGAGSGTRQARGAVWCG